MAENKKSFIAYIDWKETFDSLPDDKAGQLIKHIFAYVNDENPQTDDILINAVFANIRQTLKRDLKKWEKQHQQRVEAGRISAEKRKHPSTTIERPLNETQQASTVSVNDSVSDTVTVKKKSIDDRKSDFKKSLLPHLEKYGKDILNEFYAYWTEHGESDRKMRFEKQTSFSITRRLSTWKKNENKFSSNEKNKSNNRGGFESDTTKRTIEQIQNGFE